MLLFSTCAPRKIIKPPPEIRSPEEVLDSLVVKGAHIKSYAADMEIDFESDKLDLSFDMELYYRQPLEIAFRLEMILGIDVAKAVLRSDTVKVYSPFRNAYFEEELKEGRFIELGEFKFDLLSNIELATGRLGVSPNNTRFTGREEGLYIFETSGPTWNKTLWVNPATITVAKSHWRHRSEPYDLWMSYYDFYRVDSGWRPRLITLDSAERGFRTKVRIRQEKINVEIPDRFFQLRIPQDAKRIEPPEKSQPR